MALHRHFRRNFRRNSRPNLGLGVPPAVTLWALRLLVAFNRQGALIENRNEALIEAVGLSDLFVSDDEPPVDKVRKRLRLQRRRSEQRYGNTPLPSPLLQNIDRFAELIGLTPTECLLLGFVILLHVYPLLQEAAGYLDDLNARETSHVLAVILDVPEAEIRTAIGARGGLIRSGLLSVRNRDNCELQCKFEVLSHDFVDNICLYDTPPLHLLRHAIIPSAPGHLALADYAHLRSSLETLGTYLRESIATTRKGVNILLYGAPGTGKTQLVKALAQELGNELFEVAHEDEDGDAVDGERRLRAFRMAQSFFAQQRAILMFDEAEDVFYDIALDRMSTAQKHKAWMNRALEQNPVPTLWLSNSISGIDPAFIRRFAMVLELPIPPKCVRERILHGACGDLLDIAALARIAETECLAPAVVSKAASVAELIRGELGREKSAAAFESLVNGTLEAQGYRSVKRNDPNRLPDVYDLAFINADVDLAEVARGIVTARCGRLCLYGPSGTGKTAFGRWLAERLEMPLLVKRASDLLSKWVGGTEVNMAAAFRQAEREDALLLIDEVDGFLRHRCAAQHSWEVTEVDEMLTQIESFSGVFIASTNLMDGLDQAALRRFDLKAKLDFMRPEQSWALFRRHCAKLGFPTDEANVRRRIMDMKMLTPGDFTAVLRQNRFYPLTSSAMLAAALEAECAIKSGNKGTIGFL